MIVQHPLSLATASSSSSGSDAPASMQQAAEQLQLAYAELTYFPTFLDAAESAALFELLVTQTPWRQDTLNFGGRHVPVPRLQAWYGDRGYGYSGLKLAPLPWTPALEAVRRRVSERCALEFNSVLVNYYRDGRDSVAWHSDDERELGPDPHIASLSLGTVRRFELKHRTRKQSKMHIMLQNGSLLLMGRGLQRHWVHQLPKDIAVTTPRLNLTFRFIH